MMNRSPGPFHVPFGLHIPLFVPRPRLGPVPFVFLLPLFLFVPASAPAQQLPESYIARAGDRFISEQEFLERFELLPGFGGQQGKRLDGAKLELIYSIIAEKLLVQEALGIGLDRDSLTLQAGEQVRRLLARDELYRAEIQSKVAVTDSEVSIGMSRALRQLSTTFYYFSNEENARFIRSQMRAPADFDRLVVDSSMGALRDTATVIWGDADPAVEDAAYRLKTGEISPVVRAGGGWYIIRLRKVQVSGFYQSMTPDVLRERVTNAIRLRKERARFDEYLSEVFRGKVGYALPRTFDPVAASLREAYRRAPRDSVIYLSQAMVDEVRAEVRPMLADTLVVVGNEHWTVAEVLDRLSVKPFPVRREDVPNVPRRFNTQILIWVQQELLAQEAIQMGLDTVRAVMRKRELWRDYFLSERVKERVRGRVTVSEAEVWKYMKSQDRSVVVPQVQIRELRTKTMDEMREALAELQKGSTFDQVVRTWSGDPALRNTGGVTDWFPITERPPVGEIASQMSPGDRYGPIMLRGGPFLFELLGKKSGPVAGDTALAARLSRAREELMQMKKKRTVTLLLAQSASQRGYEVYEDRLRRLEVSPVPMMTFRKLGFGGRMFEVPFVEKQLDWLSVEPPSSTIVP